MNPVTVDVVVATVLVVVAGVTAAAGPNADPLTVLAAVTACATVAGRRRFPAAMTVLGAVGISVFTVSTGTVHATVEPLAVLLDYYMLGRLSTGRDRPAVDAVLLTLAIPAISLSPGNSSFSNIAATWALFVAVPFAGGRAIGSRAALTRELRDKAERLERDQAEQARRAAMEERSRIARELHDVVAHSVSVMVIQTQVARRVAAEDRDAARRALRSVESSGRDALTEMRRMMGVLRHGDPELPGATAPALSQLSALLARARAAGLPVELQVVGEPRELSPGLDLVAFRVVQEALTNAIKHAGPARAFVRLAFTADALELEILDTGRGPAPADARLPGAGQGLVGMRERVTLYGGELQTGRRRGGGFQVRARIPLRETVAA